MFEDFEFNDKPQNRVVEVNKIKLPDDYLNFMENIIVAKEM